ncbi:MAG TPA: copper resistance protein B [Xanthomonadaceae bacterium]|nr:copper resistance protein B [Xanthomonadaceae bacterium]
MTRFRPRFLAAAVAVVVMPAAAFAQDSGHAGMQMPMNMPMPAPSAKKPTGSPKPRTGHAQHQHRASPAPGAPAPAESAPPGSMAMPEDRPMDMPMDHPAMEQAQGAAVPRTPIPPLTDADRAAAVPPPGDHPVHDNPVESYTVFNRLEGWDASPGSGLHWEGSSWIGTDRNRLWLRSEGEERGRLESADVEVLYGRSVSPWWDVVGGVRHDFKPGASQDWAAIGVVGLAPYKFEVAATAYIGQAGQTAARLEAEYETLFTNRLILQPLVEVNLHGRDDPARGVGAGLSTAEAGLRLRYEITRRFAPYIGVVRERAFGRTADYRRADGEDTNDTRVVAGVRIWF